MIVVEGPDGSGKDTLIEKLLKDFGHELMLGPRAVKSSKEGPVDALPSWTVRDVNSWDYLDTMRIYNRHPVISEPIYGSIIRGHMAMGMSPIVTAARPIMERDCLVIWCCPDLSRVTENVHDGRDMPGVQENIRAIYKAYRAAERGWLGKKVVYDYTLHGNHRGSYGSVKLAVLSHIRERNNNHG